MVPTPTPALAAISRTGASTPEVTKMAAAASSSVCSLRRASARLRGGTWSSRPSISVNVVPSSVTPLTNRNMRPYSSGALFHFSDHVTPKRRHVRVSATKMRTDTAMPDTSRPCFGIMTAPMHVAYHDVLRVWREADEIPEIEHAWLFDHLLPIAGNQDGPIHEGWTLLSALAAQTERLRLGLLVTSNRFRPPAVLAKIAATVDIVSGGRLDFGVGAGSRPRPPLAPREYEAYGLPFHDFAHSVGSLAEALTVIRRLWTETEPFDFTGTYLNLTGAFGNPKPARPPPPPILVA